MWDGLREAVMGYELVIRSGFSAAHYLRSYKGRRESVHGHNWLVEARITADELDGESMLVDFADAKGVLDGILDEFDHANINDLPQFSEANPTAELIARYIYEELERRLGHLGARPVSVGVFETADCGIVYTGGGKGEGQG